MRKRILHLGIATLVLIAVSFAWCVAVDLTPAAERPFVGSSATNSMLNLAIGYNGIERVLGANTNIAESPVLTSMIGRNQLVPNEGGKAGLLRLFNKEMAGQASWMLILAVCGIIALFIKTLSEKGTDRKTALRQLLLWFGLFAPMYAYFSISGHFHRYYLIMLAPCLAALGAIALCEFTKLFVRSEMTGKMRWQNILLPAAVAVTAVGQVYIMKALYTPHSKTLIPVMIIGAGVSIIGLGIAKILKKENKPLAKIALAVGILGLLAAPTYWAYSPILYGTNTAVPIASPTVVAMSGVGQLNGGGPASGNIGNKANMISAEAVSYMIEHYNGARFLVAVPKASTASPIIIQYGVGVMALGGFSGKDNAISLNEFIARVGKGEIQYYWVGGNAYSWLTPWVEDNAVKVDLPQMGNSTLYDLSALKTAQ